MRVIALISLVVLTGCAQAQAVKMQHADGRSVTCGPYRVGGFNGEQVATLQQESCLNDYRAQGFIRVPN